MTNNGFRKRSRSREDFGEEFFPLSKRINSLQISGEFTFISHHHLPQEEQTQHQPATQLHSMPAYSPELSFEENPNYYRQNNVLYDLYLERMRRSKNPA